MRLPSRLQLRFLLASLVPMLLVLAVALGIANWSFTRSLEDRVAEQLRVAASELATGRLPLSAALLQRVGALLSAEVALLDAEGRPVGTSADPVPSLAAAAADQLEAARPEPGAVRVQRLEIDGEPLVVVEGGISGAVDPRVRSVLLTASLRDAREAARRTALGVVAAALLAAAALAALSYGLTRSLAAPIERLVAMAGSLAAGRRDVQVPPETAGEVGAIAQALNELGARLRSYETELAARSRSSALGEMSARIAHEIRNPLTALQLQLQMLEERVDAAERPTVGRLLDELRRLELIVTAALAEARASQRSERRPASLPRLAAEVLDLFEPSFRHRGLVLERELESVPEIELDTDRIRQALLNLLSNAADASGAGGRIRASTAVDRAGEVAILAVEDDGPGLEAERVAALQDGSGTSAKPFGLGLGLKVCAEVAAEHGGTLEFAHSEALGGARIALRLPIARAAQGPG